MECFCILLELCNSVYYQRQYTQFHGLSLSCQMKLFGNRQGKGFFFFFLINPLPTADEKFALHLYN